MYQLVSIGKLQFKGEQGEICIYSAYRRALKALDKFSHIHLFYIQPEKTQLRLQTCIVEIKAIDIKSGQVTFKNIAKDYLTKDYATKDCMVEEKLVTDAKLMDFKLQEMSLEEIEPLDIVDIKPYFPCEDSVKQECLGEQRIERPLVMEQQEERYGIQGIGMIRNTHGAIYIQLEEELNLTSDYVKVLWWFNRYDDVQYRKAVECNPPYENAPRTGIFATRSPVRPNPIAMTVARVTKMDRYEKRIYLSGIESFDQTPCIGLLEYQSERDCKIQVRVPEWLSHWPKWLEDSTAESNASFVECKKSRVSQLMIESQKAEKKTASLLNKELGFEEEFQLSRGNRLELQEKEKLENKVKVENAHKVKDGIWIQGAKENNLKNMSLTIPYHKMTAVVGVSGSGKSSLVEDTIYAECKRRMAYLSNDINSLQKPKMDYMSGCIPAVMISQREIRGNSQSTIGTYTNVYDDLRIIFSEIGVRHCPQCDEEIIPLTKEQIVELLSTQEQVKIYDLDKNPIQETTLQKSIAVALEKGKGALYAILDEGNEVLMQTRQKCYHCDQLMFELTPATFSYMDLESRCPICHGTSRVVKIDPDKIIDCPERSLLDGASSFLGKLRAFRESPNANWMKGQVFGLAEQMDIDLEQPWETLPQAFKDKVLEGTGETKVTFSYDNKKNGRKGEITRPAEGVLPIIERLYDENHQSTTIQKYMTETVCDACKGERLNKEGRMVTIGTRRYPEVAAMSFRELGKWCEALPEVLGEVNYQKVENQVIHLKEITKAARILGIDYLEMSRGTRMISGGEGQRLKLLAAMENHMTGLLYIFDEPSKGLHPKDYSKVLRMIQALKEEGNTIIMVEHNPEMIEVADHIIEIGPSAGETGGYLMAAGTWEGVLNHEGTQMSRYMKNKMSPIVSPILEEEDLEFIEMNHLTYHNLKDISIKFPKGGLTCICGVSGSGKSSLVKGEIYRRFTESKVFNEVCLMDQLPIGRSSRSVVATYIEVMEGMRKIIAQTQQAAELGYDEKAFSFNGEIGQCATCKGEGIQKLKYLGETSILCPVCKGKRYKKEILQVSYNGYHIAQLLEMSINEAKVFWNEQKEISDALKIMEEVGLGYLKMGQSTTTLSGGEASRLKLAKKLIECRKSKKANQTHKRNNILYLLDEPTTGLHFSDIEKLLHLMNQLIAEGNTIIAIEHNRQFVANCHWQIELGPGAGEQGGTLMRQGKVDTSYVK